MIPVCREIPTVYAPGLPLGDLKEPHKLRTIGTQHFVGKKLIRVSNCRGVTESGCAGFFGFQFTNGNDQNKWLILTLWGAGDWLMYKGKTLNRAMDEVGMLVGGVLKSFYCEDKMCILTFDRPDMLFGDSEEITFAGRRADDNGEWQYLAPNDSLWDAWAITNKDLCVEV